MKRNFIAILFLIWSFESFSQERKWGYSLSSHIGTTIAHTQKLASIKSSSPYGIQFDLFKQPDNQNNFNTCNCYPQTGISLMIFDYGNKNIVGQGMHLNLYIEPQFKISNRHYFMFRATAGLAFMNKPYDSIENPLNQAYSLPISGFLSLGPGWRYFFNDRYSLFFIVPFNHVSNGGIKDPNLGLNFPSIQFGISKQNYANNRMLKRTNVSLNFSKNRWSILPFYTSRTVKNGEKKRYSIFGLETNYTRKLNALVSWNSGLEFYKDDALKERYFREQNISKDRYRLGLMSGIQFDLGKIELYHRLGTYLYDPGLYNGRIFHRHGLLFIINKNFAAGFEMKAHNEVANFLDFRMRYAFGN